jgi:hypothetical protein
MGIGDLPPLEHLDPGAVDVGTPHLVPEVGEHRTRGETDIASTNDGNLTHSSVP